MVLNETYEYHGRMLVFVSVISVLSSLHLERMVSVQKCSTVGRVKTLNNKSEKGYPRCFVENW